MLRALKAPFDGVVVPAATATRATRSTRCASRWQCCASR